MGVLYWFCRCIPPLSLFLWIFVSYQALCGLLPFAAGAAAHDPHRQRRLFGCNVWELLYIGYSVAAHLSACVFFPLRLCWAVWQLTHEVRRARAEALELARPYAESEAASSTSSAGTAGSSTLVDDKASALSVGAGAPPETPRSSSRVSTPKMGGFEDRVDEVVHAIILPSYKEDMDTMRETLSVLASHLLAKSSYDVYLAMEQRDPDALSSAHALINAFQSSFRHLSYTLHPGDIPGEVAGKSSNVGWAARQLSHNYTDSESRRNCVITVMDSDTHLSSTYFLLLSKSHREDPRAASTLYCVPIIFDRNAQQVNPLVRAADIFWCGAGLSGLYRGSGVKIPTSVYSLAMSLAGDVGGWDTGPESIGEDMHMFLKCYFASKGRAQVKILYSPASQSNVSSDVRGFRGVFANLYSRYKQALRHMWGSLDSGYAARKSLEALFRRNDEDLSGWLSSSAPEDRVPRWVADSSLKHFTPPNVAERSASPTRRASADSAAALPAERLPLEPARFHLPNLLLLYHRLYEAHFLPAHLTVALLSAVLYTSVHAPPQPAGPSQYPTPAYPLLLWSFSFTGTLRLLGFVGTAGFIRLYERYHAACVRAREDEMRAAGLWADMAFAHRSLRENWTDYVALPLNGVLFGTAPAVVAGICHLWTDRLVYTVSAKPLKKLASGVKGVAERVAQLA